MFPMNEIRHIITVIGDAKSSVVTEKEVGNILFTKQADIEITDAYFKLVISLQQSGWLSEDRSMHWLK